MRAHGKVKILNRGTLISERDQVESGKLDDRARKKMKITGTSERDKGDTRLCKSTDISDEDDRKTSNPRVPSEVKAKTRFVEESVCPEKESLKIKPDVQRSRSSSGTPVITSLDHLPNEKFQKQTSEVTRKQKIDRKKWFKQEPWKDKMKTATEEGTLILLQNLDPSYTSRDVEELISCAFQRRCDARMIQWTTFSCPYSGRAFVIFRSEKDAAEVLKMLEERSLILPNKRVLVGGDGLWEIPEQKYGFVGHLSLERNRFRMQREEMKNAVSTSHCSQPNTIEYEMAMDWEFLQEKLKVQWKALYKGHEEEIKQLKKMLKVK
ncbi:hypothetical protein QJS04_geneDACA021930 [Acorus gramineus]|uniref:RRM domain-containing protein n=1 Tax=Acorus gramineus TaxID=55184 RepID=A0AAV9A483_ACOGR|nr:hypothetical protein QJS04_geneDACA021930 [Acorus gramineus]